MVFRPAALALLTLLAGCASDDAAENRVACPAALRVSALATQEAFAAAQKTDSQRIWRATIEDQIIQCAEGAGQREARVSVRMTIEAGPAYESQNLTLPLTWFAVLRDGTGALQQKQQDSFDFTLNRTTLRRTITRSLRLTLPPAAPGQEMLVGWQAESSVDK